ncbi:MAG: hypothetical protein LAP86_05075 [Acidobacteriia bacterium]|nr:hypothetical protein [Terriglobia bacterium]
MTFELACPASSSHAPNGKSYDPQVNQLRIFLCVENTTGVVTWNDTVANNRTFATAGDPSGYSSSQAVGGMVNSESITQRDQRYESKDGLTLSSVAKPYVDVRDYGAVPDGSTDNSRAIAAAFTAANAVTTGTPTVHFNCNGTNATCQYNYTGSGISPINPRIPMNIQCATGAILNYTGTAHAVDVGPMNLTQVDTRRYTIQGCTFTGGANYTAGIWVNNWIANTMITRNQFWNFGNQTNYTIVYNGNDWTPTVEGNYWRDSDGTTRNMLDAHTGGNVGVLFVNNKNECETPAGGACSVNTTGVGLWLFTGWVLNNEIKYHYPAVRYSNCSGGGCGGGQGLWLEHNLFEGNVGGLGPAISYGDPGTPGNVHLGGLTVKSNFFYWPTANNVNNIVSNETASSSGFFLDSATFAYNQMGPAPTGTGKYIFLNGGVLAIFTGNHGPGETSDLDLGNSSLTDSNKNQEFTLQFRQNNQSGGPAANNLLQMDMTGHYLSISSYHGVSLPLLCSDSSGSGTTQSCTSSPQFNSAGTSISPTAGDVIVYKTTTTNVGDLTININRTGAVHINKWGGTVLSGGEIIAGQYYLLTYDGTRWQMQNLGNPGPFGSSQQNASAACEPSDGTTTLNAGGNTTDTGQSCLPANSVIDAVVYRITTTITMAASFTIGDATKAARFCTTQSTLTAGTTGVCFAQADQAGAAGPIQSSAAKVRVTLNANPGAGAIRLIVYYHTWTPPAS